MDKQRARVRLSLGGKFIITAVAVVALLGWTPYRFLPATPAPLGQELMGFITAVLAYILLTAPFDWLGGYAFAPDQPNSTPADRQNHFLKTWLRGVLAHGALYVLLGLLLLWAGRYLGWSLFILVFVFMMFFVAFGQPELMRLVARFRQPKADLTAVHEQLRAWGIASQSDVLVWRSDDPHFTGGVAGVIGRHQIILPARWLEDWPTAVVAYYLARREFLLAENSYLRGALLSFTMQVAGMITTAAFLARWIEPDSVAAVVSVSLGFTIWSFLSDIVLSLIDRRGVTTADLRLLQLGIPREVVSQAMYLWDDAQDDEPRTAELAVNAPYPIPSAYTRLSQLDRVDPDQPWMPWHMALTGHYYSWAGLNWLARMSPSMLGRPAVWVLPISD
ncbi:MAG: hypothetical protein KDD89_12315 [Anaerolineales bacterium]|nr:hypothetical protein [Anaerolineales bacterium]